MGGKEEPVVEGAEKLEPPTEPPGIVSLEPFLVKGKTEPINASRVLEATDSLQRDALTAPLVGRDDELRGLLDAVAGPDRAIQLVATNVLFEQRVDVGSRPADSGHDQAVRQHLSVCESHRRMRYPREAARYHHRVFRQ